MKLYSKKFIFVCSSVVILLPLSLVFFQNMTMVAPATITYTQLSSVSGGQCTIRPSTAGAVFYNALIQQRTVSGLKDVEVLHHVSTRLGFGLSPFGSLVPSKTNDCTTVFIAEELARQISRIGTNTDSTHVTQIRRGLLPFSMYSRSQIDRLIWRFQQDPTTSNYTTQLNGNAHSAVWNQARREVALLMNLRNILGSQLVTAAGKLEDHQFNLEDRLAEFWSNHFNVDNSKAEQLSPGNDSLPQVMRQRAGSTFYNLLTGVIQHPAMLKYLDNHNNFYQCNTSGVCTSSNQNLARELMELHTFGVPPKITAADTTSPYGQSDVVALSEILAGWNTTPYSDSVNPGQFYFHSTLFANKTITLMGSSYPAATAAAAQSRVTAFLKVLANHASTKKNICKKIAKNLFTPSLVAQGQNVCINAWGTDGNLKAMYQAMLALPAFWSKANYKSLYRTPIEVPIASARALGMNIIDMKREVDRYGFDEVPYNPTSLTIAAYATLLPNLKSKSVWWAFFGIQNEIRSLLGTYRGEVALPIGYSDIGLDHLSSTFVDEASRITLNVSNYLEGMDKTGLRLDPVSSNVRKSLENDLVIDGPDVTIQNYIQNTLNMGYVVRFNGFLIAKSPYELPPSQQNIIETVVAKKTAWPYFASAPGSYCIDKAIATMAQSTAIQLKK